MTNCKLYGLEYYQSNRDSCPIGNECTINDVATCEGDFYLESRKQIQQLTNSLFLLLTFPLSLKKVHIVCTVHPTEHFLVVLSKGILNQIVQMESHVNILMELWSVDCLLRIVGMKRERDVFHFI